MRMQKKKKEKEKVIFEITLTNYSYY